MARSLRFASFVATLFLASCAAAQAPLCDVGCQPDPGSSSYAATRAARPAMLNARSSSVPTVPTSGVGGADPVTKNLGSESYNYVVPLVYLPGRNGLDVALNLYYNSHIWTIDTANSTATLNADRDWPSYGFRIGYGYIEYDSNTGFILTEPDGGKHQIPSTDGTYISWTTTAGADQYTIKYKNGTKVKYEVVSWATTLYRPIKITDTNGNYITITYVTHVTGRPDELNINTITDTLNRVVTFVYDTTNHTLTSITQGTRTWVTFTWDTAYILKYNFSLTAVDTIGSNDTTKPQKVLVSCAYANGTGYLFGYGDWGIVNTIALYSASPNPVVRNSIVYNYPLASAGALSSHPTYTQQTVHDGVTLSDSIWTYATTKNGDGSVNTFTVTDPTGAKSVSTLDTTGKISTVQAKDSSNNVLLTANYAWTTDPGSVPVVGSVTTTLDDNRQSKVEYLYTTNANVSQVNEYDYGLQLKRQTTYAYLTSSSYVTKHILDRVTQINVYDGYSNWFAKTVLAYDAGTPQSITGATNHDDTNYGSSFATRGNLTSVTRYPTLSTTIARAFTYDTLGNIRTAQLDCCNQKTWNYVSTNQYAYPSSVVRGPAGTQLTTSATYNFGTGTTNSGTIATSTDENGQVTSYTYDSIDRLTQTMQPNSVHADVVYTDTGASPIVTQTNSANSLKQVSTRDGLGHTLQVDSINNASSTTVSTSKNTYDALGRVARTYNPYAPADTQVYTSYSYDALGRLTTVAPPSGGNYTYLYVGQGTTVTDPAGKQKRTLNDALGRLIQVDEPGWGDATSGTGAVTIHGDEQVYAWETCLEYFPFTCTNHSTYDSGTVAVTANGFTKSVSYGQNSDTTTITTALAAAFTNDTNSPVYATASGAVLTLTAKATGSTTNYSISMSWTYDTGNFTHPSFTADSPWPTLQRGENSSGPNGADDATLTTYMSTTYDYDPLGDLVKVTQGLRGTLPPQTRTYAYDGLARLTSNTLPESGTTTLYYTKADSTTCAADASAICRKTDARSITSTYAYDGLNRLTGVTYSDGTPALANTYGTSSASFNNGRLITTATGTNSESFTYDSMGRALTTTFTIDGTGRTVTYTYNSDNTVASLQYPSTRVVNQTYDAIGRPYQISPSSGTAYLTFNTFHAAGMPLGVTYGNGVAGDFTYNDHLQVATLRYSKSGANDLLNLAYGYGTSNNGQIQSITYNTAPGTPDNSKSVSYTYDAWLRLRQAQTADSSTWGLREDYDRFGNRTNQAVIINAGPSFSAAISGTTNRITDTGYVYDNAGNMTQDGPLTSGFHSYAYDAENRAKTVDSTVATYTYIGALRVKKVVGTTTTIYIYVGSRPIAEYVNGSLSKEYVLGGRQPIATIVAGGATTYQYADHLSIRAEADATGVQTASYGHFPFGEAWYGTASGGKWAFTTYERDNESGLDYALFRNYSSRLGRMMSADPVAAHIADPQTLNAYTYTANDPLGRSDSTGLDWFSQWMNAGSNGWFSSGTAFAAWISDTQDHRLFGYRYWDLPGRGDVIAQEYYRHLTIIFTGFDPGRPGYAKPLGDTDLKAHGDAKVGALVGLDNPDCQRFLSDAGIDTSALAQAIIEQQGFDGSGSTISLFDAGLGDGSMNSMIDDGQFYGLTTTSVAGLMANGTLGAISQSPGRSAFFVQITPLAVLHEALHNLTGLGDRALAIKLTGSAGGNNPGAAIDKGLKDNGCIP